LGYTRISRCSRQKKDRATELVGSSLSHVGVVVVIVGEVDAVQLFDSALHPEAPDFFHHPPVPTINQEARAGAGNKQRVLVMGMIHSGSVFSIFSAIGIHSTGSGPITRVAMTCILSSPRHY
jgi:hypothetical protein